MIIKVITYNIKIIIMIRKISKINNQIEIQIFLL